MSELNDATIALNVRLKLSEPSAHPSRTNYTNVAIAQGIAYLDFGFIEPGWPKMAQAAPKGVEGHLITRVAMDVGTLSRLQQRFRRCRQVCAKRGRRRQWSREEDIQKRMAA